MSILKYLGGTLPRKTIFNKYLSIKSDNKLIQQFGGLCIFYDWLYEDKRGFKNKPHRFQSQSCGNDPMRALLFGPMFLGFTGSLVVALFILVYPFSKDPFSWWFLYLVLGWNLFFLNLQPFWQRIFPPNIACFD